MVLPPWVHGPVVDLDWTLDPSLMGNDAIIRRPTCSGGQRVRCLDLEQREGS